MRKVFIHSILCGLLCAATVAAQENKIEVAEEPHASPTPLAYKTNRQDEDWSPLADKTRRADWSDELKYVSLGKENWYLSIGGEARPFYEFYRSETWGSAPKDGNGWVLERYMLHADFHFGKRARVFAQIKSGLINNRTGGARGSDLDKLDLHQLFFDYKFTLSKDGSLLLRAGRQEISFGSSRLVGVREGPNVRQSFDGARFSSKLNSWSLDAFLVKPVSTGKGFFDDEPQNQQTFAGVYAVSPNGFLTKKGRVDFYYFGLDKKTARFNQGTAREIRHTIGTRVWNNVNSLDYNFEFAYQFGKFGAGNINAYTAASDTGYTAKNWLFRPRFGLKANVTSGDKNADDKNLQTFNALFPRGAYFGQFSPVGPYNHTDLHSSVAFNPTAKIAVNLDWINFWRTSRNDGVYSVAGALIRTGNKSAARFIGRQFAVETSYKVDRHTTLTANYSRFDVGRFLRETPPAKNTNYFAAWLTYKF